MKKLFISCPMKDRTDAAIKATMKKMHRLAEIIFDEELEIIPSYIGFPPPENVDKAIWRLGERMQMMSEADYYAGIAYVSDMWNDCRIEADVAAAYGIKSYFFDLSIVAPDCYKLVRDY